MYRKVLKDVIKDLERTNDLIEVSEYLKACNKNEFLNIINELLNQLSEEKIENNMMKKKIKELTSEKEKIKDLLNSVQNEII